MTVGGVSHSKTFHTYLWDSPYLHLDGDATEVTLDRLRGVVERHNSGVDLGEYFLESKPVDGGETLAVRGEMRVEGGDRVVTGSDDTPLVVSNRGFDGLAGDLRTRAVKYGLLSVGVLAGVGALFLW